MTEERLRNNLQLLGLSSKEIDTYLTILDHGEAKVSEIIADSEVSQRYVYQMCEQLDERGLVILNDHVRPSMVRAQDPESVVEGINKQLDEVKADVTEQLANQKPAELEVELIKSRQTIIKRWKRFIDRATEEVFICMPAAKFERFESELAAAVDRDATVYVLLTEPGLNEFDRGSLVGRASIVRTWDAEPRPLLTVDNEIMIHDEPKLFIDEGAEGSAVSLTRSSVAGNLFSTYLSNYWRIADQEYLCEPDELPKSYPQLRNALVHATLHKRAGNDLTATIRAQHTTTGELTEMHEVPIVEIRQGLIEPFTNTFPVENGLSVSYDGEVVTVGGIDAIVEDYEALDITLDVAE